MSDKLNLDEIEQHVQAALDMKHDTSYFDKWLRKWPSIGTILAADVQALLAERERLVGIINETIAACYEHKLDETARAIKARLDGAPA